MKLSLIRNLKVNEAVIGNIFIDGIWQCFSLENLEKIIPEGTFELTIDFSNRFQRPMPHILDVPDRTGIRIHPGNKRVDVIGCIAVGISKVYDYLYGSRIAFNALFARLEEGLKQGKVFIEISHQDSSSDIQWP